MGKCCGQPDEKKPAAGGCPTTQSACCCGAAAGGDGAAETPCVWFSHMIQHCYEYAVEMKKAGRPIVGILCEYTPRELIMEAGGVPVCLCGGSAETIPAAEQHLPANLCPLIKSTYGYHVQHSNPFLEMADLIVAETTCDGKKKMYELMAETRPMYVLELPHKAADADALEYWVQELTDMRAFLAERFAVPACDDRLRAAIRSLNRERALRREVSALMQADCPPVRGRQVLDAKSSIWDMPDATRQYERMLEICRAKSQEAPATACSASRPVRVLMTGVPQVHGAERVLDIIESSGGLVVAMENCTGVKPLLDDVDAEAADPLRALAAKYFHLPCSVMTPNTRRFDDLRQLAADYRPECIVELTWQACLTYDVEAYHVKRFAEGELGLPYLHIETDYSPSDSARITMRVEALLETVRERRSAAACGRP